MTTPNDALTRLVGELNDHAEATSNPIVSAALAKAAAEITSLSSRCAELERLVYVPGLWRCAKCDFTLLQSNLNALDGTVTARDTPGDKCPNCNSPLWRVSERDAHKDAMDTAERFWNEKQDLERAHHGARKERAGE